MLHLHTSSMFRKSLSRDWFQMFVITLLKKIYENTEFSFLRCRCTERLVPGCTRKFCNLEQSTKTPQLIQTPVNQGSASDTRNNNNNNGAGVVNFPGASSGASSGALTREDKKVCLDSEGNERCGADLLNLHPIKCW